MERFDAVVIGGGTAGFAAATEFRRQGRRIAIVTGPGDLGGTCIRRGCMPAKTLLSATEAIGNVQKADAVGVEPERVHLDAHAIVERKRELVDYFAEDRMHELEQYPLVRERAAFADERTIVAGDREIRAERFVIATGSQIVAPPIPGLAEAGYLISDDVLELEAIPRTIAIIGGGPVGCEFALYFARFGAHVTLLQAELALLRNDDRDVADAVRRALEADGVDVRTDTVVRTVVPSEGKRLLVVRDGVEERLDVAAIMLATGRVPAITGLGLEHAGIVTLDGAVAVDAYLQTTNPRVFAAGDVLGRRDLVHVAEYAGRLAAVNAFSGQHRSADFERYEAHGVYTQPQVAVAGLTERQCQKRGLAVRVARHPFSDVGKAVVSAETTGFIKMLVDDSDRIRGVAIVSDDAIDLLGEAIALIDRGATPADVIDMPHLHPTMGEIYVRVAERLVA